MLVSVSPVGWLLAGLAGMALTMPAGVAAQQGYDWQVEPHDTFCQARLIREENDYVIDVLAGKPDGETTFAMIGITSIGLGKLSTQQVAEAQLWTTYPTGELQSSFYGNFTDRAEVDGGAISISLMGGDNVIDLVEDAGGLVLMWKDDIGNWERRFLPLNVSGQTGAAGMGALRYSMGMLPKP